MYVLLQLPVVQPFPGGKEDDEEIMAVISLAALSQHLLSDPDIIEAPVIRFASQKVCLTHMHARVLQCTHACACTLMHTHVRVHEV